jgi:hypothetical protein
MICKRPFAIDHDHSHCSNQKACSICVRGLLCPQCNQMLGFARERIDVLDAAKQYLKTIDWRHKMASGVINPGGLKAVPAGGLHEVNAGGVNANNYRILRGGTSVDPGSPLVSSGARVAVTRKVANVTKDARTTSVTYAWTLPTVPGGSTTAVTSITGTTTPIGTFTPDVAGVYIFRCTVTFVKAAGNTTQQVNFTYTSA